MDHDFFFFFFFFWGGGYLGGTGSLWGHVSPQPPPPPHSYAPAQKWPYSPLFQGMNKKNILTWFLTNTPIIVGPRIPGMVPIVFVIPIRNPPYAGAMSRWFTLKPDMARPPVPTASVKHVTATTWLHPMYPATTRNMAGKIRPTKGEWVLEIIQKTFNDWGNHKPGVFTSTNLIP